MATGAVAFGGSTTAVIFDAILNRAPASLLELNPALPAQLEQVTNKLLEKDREMRYQSASDVRTDLKRAKRDTESGRTRHVATTPVQDAMPSPASIAAAPVGVQPATTVGRKIYTVLAACLAAQRRAICCA